jgi:FXSXX-COOH protein
MNSVADQPTGGHELPDVRTMTLAALMSANDGVLANALRRFRDEADNPAESLSAFQSFIDEAIERPGQAAAEPIVE